MASARTILSRLPPENPHPPSGTTPMDAKFLCDLLAERRDHETARRLTESGRSLGKTFRFLAWAGALLGTLAGILALIPSKGVSLLVIIACWIHFAVLYGLGNWFESASSAILRLLDAARKDGESKSAASEPDSTKENSS